LDLFAIYHYFIVHCLDEILKTVAEILVQH